MSSVELSRPLADPKHVGGAVVEDAGGGVFSGQRLLVGEEKALVGGPEVCGGHDRMVNGQPGCGHEA